MCTQTMQVLINDNISRAEQPEAKQIVFHHAGNCNNVCHSPVTTKLFKERNTLHVSKAVKT